MSASSAPSPINGSRKRHWRRWLLALLTALLVSLPWLLPPERIADLVLRQIGPGLQLEMTRSGAAAWRLRGGPMLEVHGLAIREIGTETAWLEAGRVLIAVPWRTVRGLGKVLDATRLEIDSARLDLAQFRHWLDQRPPGASDFPLPTLADGAYLTNLKLHANGWKLDTISMQLDPITHDTPARGKLSAHYIDTTTQANVDLRLSMTRPTLPAGAAVVGSARIQRENAVIPLQFTLAAPLRAQGIPNATLVLSGGYSRPDAAALAFALNLSGRPEFGDTIALSPLALELTGSGPLPSLNATGSAALADDLSIHLGGELPVWPSAWPALPAPLNRLSRFDFSLDYTGAPDLSGQLQLELQRGPTRLNAAVHPQQLADWLTRAPASPLPPLQARLSTPTLELPGATLSGIVIETEP